MPDYGPREAALSQDDLGQFADAVVAAFPDKELLFAILLKSWGVRVSDVVYTEKPGKLVVADLVEWSHAQGRALDMLELVWGEVQDQVRPLQALAGRLLEPAAPAGSKAAGADNLGLGIPMPFDWQSPAPLIPGPELDGSQAGQALLARLRSGLCVIAQSGVGRASGFLVGKRHVLTSYSAVSNLVESDGGSPEVHFDTGPGSDRWPIAVAGNKTWLAAFRGHGAVSSSTSAEDEARELDFALIRLAEDVSPERHGLPLPQAVPIATPGEPVFLLEFALARDLRVSPGTLVKYSSVGTRVHYDAESERGSAGAPVVTRTGDLIAMHHAKVNSAAGERSMPQGVPIWRIRAAIAESGLDPDDL